MKRERIPARLLAERAGVSYSHMLLLRRGKSEPTRIMMLWLTEAACYVLRRRVGVSELFDLTVHVDERRIMYRVKAEQQPQPPRAEDTPFERFQKLTRALFRVDKRDVPKHEPTKRSSSRREVGSKG
jgi:transcriptional regulator with XRE-family HTH domain